MQPNESGESSGGSGECHKVQVLTIPVCVEIDEEQIMSSTQAGAYAFQNSLGKVVIIGGPCIPFIFQFFTLRSTDRYWLLRKQFQKLSTKQGLKFELKTNTIFC